MEEKKRQGDHKLMRLSKRYDLDLIALHRGGISLGKILLKALYSYLKDESFSVIVEPVSNIELSNAVNITYEKDAATKVIVTKTRPIEVGFWLCQDSAKDLISPSHIRSVYGNEFCKQLVRLSIINLPLSVYMRTDQEVNDYIGSQDSSFNFNLKDEISSWIHNIDKMEQAKYKRLLEKAGPEVYIADRKGNLIRKSEFDKVNNKPASSPGQEELLPIRKTDVREKEAPDIPNALQNSNVHAPPELDFFNETIKFN